jgi:flagellar motility protein MotE (MotC chaperone)
MKNALKLYLVLVFLSGAVVGGVAVQLYNTRSVRGFNPADARKRYADELRTRLNLTPEQSQQLDDAFRHTRERYRVLREKYEPEVKAIQEEHTDTVRQMLSLRQQAEYEKMRQERDARRRSQDRPDHPRKKP